MAPAAYMTKAEVGYGSAASEVEWNRCVGMPERAGERVLTRQLSAALASCSMLLEALTCPERSC